MGSGDAESDGVDADAPDAGGEDGAGVVAGAVPVGALLVGSDPAETVTDGEDGEGVADCVVGPGWAETDRDVSGAGAEPVSVARWVPS